MRGNLISKLPKLLVLLALLQVALVLLLFMKLNSFEQRVDLLAATTQQKPHNGSIALSAAENGPASVQTGVNSQQLRKIVREELHAALADNNSAGQNPATNSQNPVFDEAEMQYQRDMLVQELEFFKTQDEVSHADLNRFMGDIAKLNPQARTELLNMLNRAMNRGKIKGNL